jgi:hypothetical protein
MRYLWKCRVAGLAALASLVVAAFAVAPAGANTVCKGTAPYQTCQSVKVSVHAFHHRKVKIAVTVNDTPTLTVKLYKFKNGHYKFYRNIFRGNVASGTKKFSVRVKKAGKYQVKAKANGHGLVATASKKFRAKR